MLFLGLAAAGAWIDLWSKHIAFTNLPSDTSPEVKIIDGFYSVGRTWNHGIVFGWFQGAGPIFLWISVLAVPAIIAIFHAVKKPFWTMTAALGLILGGTIGNAYDRVMWGAVRDFIKFYYWGGKIWPLFNLADSCICVGVALLTVEMLFFDEKKKPAEGPQVAPLAPAPAAPAPPEATHDPIIDLPKSGP